MLSLWLVQREEAQGQQQARQPPTINPASTTACVVEAGQGSAIAATVDMQRVRANVGDRFKSHIRTYALRCAALHPARKALRYAAAAAAAFPAPLTPFPRVSTPAHAAHACECDT